MKNSSLSNCSDLVAFLISFPYPMHVALLVLWSVHNLAQNLTAPNRVCLISIIPHQATSTSFRLPLPFSLNTQCSFLPLLPAWTILSFPWITGTFFCLHVFEAVLSTAAHAVTLLCAFSALQSLSYNLIDIKYSLVLFQQNSKLSVQHSPWR